jgi:hypothetical protein
MHSVLSFSVLGTKVDLILHHAACCQFLILFIHILRLAQKDFCSTLSTQYLVLATTQSFLLVTISEGIHLFPFRTEQLSPREPMILSQSGLGK